MQRITRSAIHRSAWAASAPRFTLGLFACGGVDSSSPPVTQQDFGYDAEPDHQGRPQVQGHGQERPARTL